MDNYEYLIAGLPVLSTDWTAHSNLSASELIEDIRELCSERDNSLFDQLLAGYEEENFNEEFYSGMLSHSNLFLREFFRFDLNLRNAKVRYLNQRLGRPEDQDIFMDDSGEFEEKDAVEKVLFGDDLLKRERGIDDLVWDKVSDLTTFDYFNVSALLGYIAKLKIIDRWLQLDENTGREMFRKLVDEIRGTFKGVEFNDI